MHSATQPALPAPTNDELHGRGLLYGDGFSAHHVAAWYGLERDAYHDMSRGASSTYGYHALNRRHLLRYLPERPFAHALMFGGATGAELAPIARLLRRATIVDSAKYEIAMPADVETAWLAARADGRLDMDSESVDLITSIGTLHHVANVSAVFAELVRVLAHGGYLLLRETTTSMGDWRQPRRGLTPCERGIPPGMLRALARRHMLEVRRWTPCVAAGSARLAMRLGIERPWNVPSWVLLDEVVSRLLSPNATYHAMRPLERLRPTAVACVLVKV